MPRTLWEPALSRFFARAHLRDPHRAMGERDFGGRACTYGYQYERSVSALNCPWLASHDRHGVGRADWRPWADGPRHARPTRILCFRHCPRPARIGGCRGAASVRGDDGAIADRGSGPRPPRGWRSPPDTPSHVSPPGPTNGPFQCSGSGDRSMSWRVNLIVPPNGMPNSIRPLFRGSSKAACSNRSAVPSKVPRGSCMRHPDCGMYVG